jgi:hypothetical protein
MEDRVFVGLNQSRRCRAAFVLLLSGGVMQTACASNEVSLVEHLNAVSRTLNPPVQATLEQIPALDRRLLALRAYVRAGSTVESRWSWTKDEIRTYQGSDDYRQLIEDLAKVSETFERQNPGYTLFANTEVRSLDVQIERWNSNPRVGTTAANLRAATLGMLERAPVRPSAASLQEFKSFLASWRPSPVSPLAAPGLSMHGRMRAVDFQIMRNGRIVAATEVGAVASQWEAPGWARKLKQAVVSAGVGFEGPLKSPNEPWHYEYKGREWVANRE